MKGEINMDIAKVQFVVLKIEEHKLSDQPYKVKVWVEESFDNISDANKYKDAKDTLSRVVPQEYDWITTQYKVQQIFFKSFVQADKSA
jgi:hypothetical protein|tara:strand:- start:381 stop:644 length:264 start_codon:yes stop_codon:yes gene_type:complete